MDLGSPHPRSPPKGTTPRKGKALWIKTRTRALPDPTSRLGLPSGPGRRALPHGRRCREFTCARGNCILYCISEAGHGRASMEEAVMDLGRCSKSACSSAAHDGRARCGLAVVCVSGVVSSGGFAVPRLLDDIRV